MHFLSQLNVLGFYLEMNKYLSSMGSYFEDIPFLELIVKNYIGRPYKLLAISVL